MNNITQGSRSCPVHENRPEVGQRLELGLAPVHIGPQRVTDHLLVSGTISDKHLCYGSQVAMKLPVHLLGLWSREAHYAGS